MQSRCTHIVRFLSVRIRSTSASRRRPTLLSTPGWGLATTRWPWPLSSWWSTAAASWWDGSASASRRGRATTSPWWRWAHAMSGWWRASSRWARATPAWRSWASAWPRPWTTSGSWSGSTTCSWRIHSITTTETNTTLLQTNQTKSKALEHCAHRDDRLGDFDFSFFPSSSPSCFSPFSTLTFSSSSPTFASLEASSSLEASPSAVSVFPFLKHDNHEHSNLRHAAEADELTSSLTRRGQWLSRVEVVTSIEMVAISVIWTDSYFRHDEMVHLLYAFLLTAFDSCDKKSITVFLTSGYHISILWSELFQTCVVFYRIRGALVPKLL